MAQKTQPLTNALPGDFSEQEAYARMIRVNHAGEYGAKRIYEGQLAMLKGTKSEPVIRHMLSQEEKHLKTFTTMVPEHRVRPTGFLPLWHVAGYALGAATALLGERVAMACTVAVEQVIDQHYGEQEKQLPDGNFKNTIAQFRAEEREHHDTAMEREAELAPAYELLTTVIKTGSKIAIWLSSHL